MAVRQLQNGVSGVQDASAEFCRFNQQQTLSQFPQQFWVGETEGVGYFHAKRTNAVRLVRHHHVCQTEVEQVDIVGRCLLKTVG